MREWETLVARDNGWHTRVAMSIDTSGYTTCWVGRCTPRKHLIFWIVERWSSAHCMTQNWLHLRPMAMMYRQAAWLTLAVRPMIACDDAPLIAQQDVILYSNPAFFS